MGGKVILHDLWVQAFVPMFIEKCVKKSVYRPELLDSHDVENVPQLNHILLPLYTYLTDLMWR